MLQPEENPQDVKEGGSITGLCQGQIPAVHHAESGRICDHSAGRYSRTWKRGPYQHTGNHWFSELGVAFTGFCTGQKGTAEIWQTDRGYKAINLLLFTHHYPARCFGMNMPKSRDIQAKIPLPQAIWNEFWLRYCERSEQ